MHWFALFSIFVCAAVSVQQSVGRKTASKLPLAKVQPNTLVSDIQALGSVHTFVLLIDLASQDKSTKLRNQVLGSLSLESFKLGTTGTFDHVFHYYGESHLSFYYHVIKDTETSEWAQRSWGKKQPAYFLHVGTDEEKRFLDKNLYSSNKFTDSIAWVLDVRILAKPAYLRDKGFVKANGLFHRVHELLTEFEHDPQNTLVQLSETGQLLEQCHPSHPFTNLDTMKTSTRWIIETLETALKSSSTGEEAVSSVLQTVKPVKWSAKFLASSSARVALINYDLTRSLAGETIPNIVHFIKSDVGAGISFLEYLSIQSAVINMQADKVLLHCVTHPKGFYWDILAPNVELRILQDVPKKMGKQKIWRVQHISDVLRMEILLEEGGIYLDTDVIALKPFTPLLKHSMILGVEKLVKDYEEVVGNAVMLARPNSPYLHRMHDSAPLHFVEDCYTCHSVQMAADLSRANPEEVYIADWKAFYFPGWEESAYDLLFKTNYSPQQIETNFADTFAIHLFKSNKNFREYRDMTPESLMKSSNTFSSLVRPLLPVTKSA